MRVFWRYAFSDLNDIYGAVGWRRHRRPKSSAAFWRSSESETPALPQVQEVSP